MKDLEYYMALPYTINLTLDCSEPSAGIFVSVKELPGCISDGTTAQEVAENIKEAMELWIEMALEDGDPIPEPEEDA